MMLRRIDSSKRVKQRQKLIYKTILVETYLLIYEQSEIVLLYWI